MGLRPLLAQFRRAHQGPGILRSLLQPASPTQLIGRPATDQSRSQRPWVGQLATSQGRLRLARTMIIRGRSNYRHTTRALAPTRSIEAQRSRPSTLCGDWWVAPRPLLPLVQHWLTSRSGTLRQCKRAGNSVLLGPLRHPFCPLLRPLQPLRAAHKAGPTCQRQRKVPTRRVLQAEHPIPRDLQSSEPRAFCPVQAALP